VGSGHARQVRRHPGRCNNDGKALLLRLPDKCAVSSGWRWAERIAPHKESRIAPGSPGTPRIASWSEVLPSRTATFPIVKPSRCMDIVLPRTAATTPGRKLVFIERAPHHNRIHPERLQLLDPEQIVQASDSP